MHGGAQQQDFLIEHIKIPHMGNFVLQDMAIIVGILPHIPWDQDHRAEYPIGQGCVQTFKGAKTGIAGKLFAGFQRQREAIALSAPHMGGGAHPKHGSRAAKPHCRPNHGGVSLGGSGLHRCGGGFCRRRRLHFLQHSHLSGGKHRQIIKAQGRCHRNRHQKAQNNNSPKRKPDFPAYSVL